MGAFFFARSFSTLASGKSSGRETREPRESRADRGGSDPRGAAPRETRPLILAANSLRIHAELFHRSRIAPGKAPTRLLEFQAFSADAQRSSAFPVPRVVPDFEPAPRSTLTHEPLLANLSPSQESGSLLHREHKPQTTRGCCRVARTIHVSRESTELAGESRRVTARSPDRDPSDRRAVRARSSDRSRSSPRKEFHSRTKVVRAVPPHTEETLSFLLSLEDGAAWRKLGRGNTAKHRDEGKRGRDRGSEEKEKRAKEKKSNVGRDRDDVRPRERTTKNITFPRTDLTRLNRDGPRTLPLPGEAFFRLADAVPLRFIGPTVCFRFSRSNLIPASPLVVYSPPLLRRPLDRPSIDIAFSLSTKDTFEFLVPPSPYTLCSLSPSPSRHLLSRSLSLRHPLSTSPFSLPPRRTFHYIVLLSVYFFLTSPLPSRAYPFSVRADSALSFQLGRRSEPLLGPFSLFSSHFRRSCSPFNHRSAPSPLFVQRSIRGSPFSKGTTFHPSPANPLSLPLQRVPFLFQHLSLSSFCISLVYFPLPSTTFSLSDHRSVSLALFVQRSIRRPSSRARASLSTFSLVSPHSGPLGWSCPPLSHSSFSLHPCSILLGSPSPPRATLAPAPPPRLPRSPPSRSSRGPA